MGQLLTSPSGGQSEVIETLHYQGALTAGIQLFRICDLVSKRWGGDENREQSDPVWEADTLTVLGQLQVLGYVVGHDDQSGAVVDLTGSPGQTTRVVLTGAGRAYARHPRPRARYLGKAAN
jgi:hypothetical protein